MNLYTKYPNFPKYRTTLGMNVIVIYGVSMVIHILKLFGDFWSTVVAIIGTLLMIICYIFCVIWDTQEENSNFKKRYDNFNNNNR